jgi:hypothetical protein
LVYSGFELGHGFARLDPQLDLRCFRLQLALSSIVLFRVVCGIFLLLLLLLLFLRLHQSIVQARSLGLGTLRESHEARKPLGSVVRPISVYVSSLALLGSRCRAEGACFTNRKRCCVQVGWEVEPVDSTLVLAVSAECERYERTGCCHRCRLCACVCVAWWLWCVVYTRLAQVEAHFSRSRKCCRDHCRRGARLRARVHSPRVVTRSPVASYKACCNCHILGAMLSIHTAVPLIA